MPVRPGSHAPGGTRADRSLPALSSILRGMSDDRSAGDRESLPPNADPEESVGPATPVRSDGDDREEPSPASPPGEHVSRPQPIDPARRQARPAAGSGLSQREPAPNDQGAAEGQEPARRAEAGRPAAGRAPSSRRARAASARGAVDRVRRADFPVVLRGYDRTAVDAYVADVAQLVAELEATQLPETVVQRALDEVGEETSTILKRAHEAGEEITARSRSQAEDRLQRAEREADLTRKEAEDQARKLEDDIQNLWQERRRLIEDIRTLADDVLALADDAIERLSAPGGEQGEDERGAGGGPAGQEEPVDAERPGVLDRPEGGAAGAGAMSTGSPPLGVGAEPPAGDASSEEDEEPDDVTVEQRPEDEDTAERPPGAAGV